ncbi:cell wall-binding repeat-containing protein [Herbiconiux sp. P18]|uniref:cell wall-binding repeat-containing protein n=1 Tax=Herbiconiux liangxiaofengii TaxID=3342795 RepID=UPI0035B79BAB
MFRRIMTRGAAAVATLAVVATSLVAAGSATAAERPADGLIGEYVFSQAAGASVANSATGAGALGAATVVNGTDAAWTGDSLVFSGGAKSSGANWVRLPNGILAGKTSASITTEVKIDASMKSTFNFLWNVGNDSPTSYFFASVRDTPRTAITTGSNAGEVNARSGTALEAGRWYSLTSVIDGAAGTIAFYVDGVKVGQAASALTPASITDQSLNAIGRSPWPDPFFKGEVSTFRVYDRALSDADVAAVSDTDAAIHAEQMAAAAQAVLDGLDLADQTVDSSYVGLPTAGGAVTWTTSDPTVVAADGTVNQPSEADGPATVTATATSTVRGVTATTSITLTVLPTSDEERAAAAAAAYVLPPVVVSGSTLPAAVDGTSVTLQNAQGIAIAADGTVTAADGSPADADGAVTGTVDAVVSKSGTPAVTVQKTFTLKVLPAAGTEQLLGYHRTPTTANEANNADVALSLHLALKSPDAADWTPLNENYGIFFPKTSVVPPADGTSDAIIRSLVNPSVFTLEDGSYGVIATRTARDGGADGSATSSVLVATSADLLSFDEVGLLDLGETNGVNAPSAVYDSAADTYLVAWTDDSGTAKHTTVSDLADAGTRGAVVAGAVTSPGTVESASGIDDYVAGRALPVPAATVTALEERYGRIANTGYTPFGDVTTEVGTDASALELPGTVGLDYSDGSTGSLPVTWDTSTVDTSTPGTYPVTGTVKQTQYPVPFADERADPSVYKYDWNGTTKYLMIATNDLYGSNVEQQGAAKMPIRVADSITGLSDAAGATEIDLLKRGDTDAQGAAMTGCFWAPEYHEINGRLSILFMPCYGSNPDMWSGRASIMQLKQDASGADLDPAVPANWTKPEKVLRTDGSDLNKVAGISLDMTFFQDEKGQSYYAWQQLGAIFIAKVDPAKPTRLTSEPVRILVPEYAWDNTIAEGPNVVNHDGVLQLIYSGSTVGDTYTTGLATADASGDTDLTSPSAWTKLNYPIQKSGLYDGAWQLGTGHGMWSEDEDGNMIYVFHARTDHNGLSGRDMFVRRVHWSAEGLPVLDMESEEELASPTVTIDVVVTGVAAPEVSRIAGADRFEVSVNTSKAGWSDGSDTVYVASGEVFPDALSAASAATVADAPILLTTSGSLPASVKAEIQRLGATDIVIVGGPKTISAAVETELKKLGTVTRIGGADRFEASRNIAKHAFPDGAEVAVLATGLNFPDALSAGAAVAGRGPVVLVNGGASGLDAATKSLLTDLGVDEIAVAGGTASVSAGIQTDAAAIAETVRLGGADRFAASRAINAHFVTEAQNVLLATGSNFPDALSGSAFGPRTGAPLFTVQGTCVPAETLEQITALGAEQITLLGGTATLSPAVEELMACRS